MIARVGAATMVSGALLALAGNLLHPRYGDDPDVVTYRKIAGSDRFRIADVVIVVAIVLVTAGLVSIARSWHEGTAGALGHYGRLAALAGGTLALAQTGLETYGLKQQAAIFSSARPNDVVGAFWATNAIDHVNVALFATWTIVFLGIAPLLLGGAQSVAERGDRRLGVLGIAGGAVCLVVGVVSLVKQDQGPMEIPFLVGSLLVTAWLLLAGIALWRSAGRPQAIDLPGASVPSQAPAPSSPTRAG